MRIYTAYFIKRDFHNRVGHSGSTNDVFIPKETLKSAILFGVHIYNETEFEYLIKYASEKFSATYENIALEILADLIKLYKLTEYKAYIIKIANITFNNHTDSWKYLSARRNTIVIQWLVNVPEPFRTEFIQSAGSGLLCGFDQPSHPLNAEKQILIEIIENYLRKLAPVDMITSYNTYVIKHTLELMLYDLRGIPKCSKYPGDIDFKFRQ